MLGLDTDKKLVLIMGGKHGCRHIGLLIKFWLLNTDGKGEFRRYLRFEQSCLQAFP